MTTASVFERILRHDRIAVVIALVAVIALAWGYLFVGAGMNMHEMDGMSMPTRMGPWTTGYTLLVFVMWAVMMAAMMLPSAAPMILLYGTIVRRRRSSGALSLTLFVSGYIAAWTVFSGVAVLLQFGLEWLALVSPMMQMTSVSLAALVLIAAGLYQWTPLKQSCLRRCRSPLDFIMTEWRDGNAGAFVMGLRHGVFCLGCCWLLMLLLFVGGVMNLVWIAGLAAFVLIEKLAPAGHWIGQVAGVALIVWGGAILAALAPWW